jgi:hypothetical protein
LQLDHQKQFNYKAFTLAIIGLIIVVLVDTTFVKTYDIVNKQFIPIQGKTILFSVVSSLCLVLQFCIIRYIHASIKVDLLGESIRIRYFYIITLLSLCLVTALMGFSIFEQFYFGYYSTWVTISIISITYGTASILIIWLSKLFFSWYQSSLNLVVFLYFISMVGIAFNLIMTAAYADTKVADKPSHIGIYVGGGGDITGGKHLLLDTIYRISSLVSFFGIWLTTAILMYKYKENLVRAVIFWIMLAIPIVYFLVTYFYQFLFGTMLIPLIETDPVTYSVILAAFLTLSKPIGGLVFGAAFWNISRLVSYERNIRISMIISGLGIFFIFAANQAVAQMVTPYPPFGLSTITILNLAAYLMLLGIYNSATLVSANANLRRHIHKHALESKLLGLIGHAEFEREIQTTVGKIIKDTPDLEYGSETKYELDENELKKYLDIVIKEVKKEGESDSPI